VQGQLVQGQLVQGQLVQGQLVQRQLVQGQLVQHEEDAGGGRRRMLHKLSPSRSSHTLLQQA
jgi:hypothetical protein